jgi:type VI secretion system secreted protein VgrG
MPKVMEIATPLGEDLLFHGMHAYEEMSRPFEYQLDLLSVKPNIPLDDILGKNVTVKLALPDDSTRYFNGYVTRFAQGGTYGRYIRYFAVVRSWLWFLSRTADCRIFQDMTVPDIVKTVFGEEPTNDFTFELTSTYRKWTYCVQYRETDFNFVSRLMEEEGIYYYVRHTDGHNTVVLTDSTAKHVTSPGYTTIPFIAPEQVVRPELEHISSWDFGREIQPGVYAHTDYDLERPGVKLLTQKAALRKHAPTAYEVYDYPGHYVQKADGEHYAAVRIDEVGSQFETAQAATNARGVSVGSLFTLDGFAREDQNREHLILAASYDLQFSDYEAMPDGAGTSYRCSFVSMSSEQQFRPKRITPKPFVQGPQTAVVVGPAGDELYKDDYGRVKVQFHWDRYGKRDENSSCWIRVAQMWAGKGWGSVSTPRIGHEVIVEFLEGDPDQPIIIGSVHNAENMPPHGGVVSGLKSNTHKGAGYNEMSMDDTAGTEKITIHGQFDMNTTIEHDQTSTIHNNRTDTIDVDDSETVGGNQTQHVVKNQTINVDVNRQETVGGTETMTITGHRSETVNGGEDVTVTGSRTHTVNGAQATTISLAEAHTVGGGRAHTVGAVEAITVGGAQMVTVGAMQQISVGISQSTTVGGARSVTVGAAQTTKIAGIASMSVGAAETHTVALGRTTGIGAVDATKVGTNYVLDAGDSVTIKTGDASITMMKDGTIVIKGKDLTLDGSGNITVKAAGNAVVKGKKTDVN